MVYFGRLLIPPNEWSKAYQRFFVDRRKQFFRATALGIWYYRFYYRSSTIAPVSIPVVEIEFVLPVLTMEEDLFYLVFREKVFLTSEAKIKAAIKYQIDLQQNMNNFVAEFARKRIKELTTKHPFSEMCRDMNGKIEPVIGKWEFSCKCNDDIGVDENE